MNKSTWLNNFKDRLNNALKLCISRNATITTEEMHIYLNHTKLKRPEFNSDVIR